MAIEDGLCLAELLQGARADFDEAFRKFAAHATYVTVRVTLESRYLWGSITPRHHPDDLPANARERSRGGRSSSVSPWLSNSTGSALQGHRAVRT